MIDEDDFSCEEYCNPWSQDIFDEMNLQTVSVCYNDASLVNIYFSNNNLNTNTIVYYTKLIMQEAIGSEDQRHISNQETGTNQNVNDGLRQPENIDNNNINEEDIEIFLENETEEERLNDGADTDDKYIPSIGMQFKSADEAQRFCNEYSYMARFSLVVATNYRTTSKKRSVLWSK